MSSFFYRVKSNHNKLGFCTCLEAKDLNEAWEKIQKRNNIKVVVERYDKGSMLEGQIRRQYHAIDGKRVEVEISPYAEVEE
jgi:hypothetical protein